MEELFIKRKAKFGVLNTYHLFLKSDWNAREANKALCGKMLTRHRGLRRNTWQKLSTHYTETLCSSCRYVLNPDLATEITKDDDGEPYLQY